MRFRTTDKFEVVMLMMTALCCSVALVSCGKTAKSRDAEKHAAEVAEQVKVDNARKAAEKAKADEAQAAANKKINDDALKALEEKERERKLRLNAPSIPPGAIKPGTGPSPTPIGTIVNNKDTNNGNRDNKNNGTNPTTNVVPGPAGTQGQQGGQGPQGAAGRDGKDGQTLVVGGGGGQVAGGAPGGVQGGGSSTVPPRNPPGSQQSGLATDFAAVGLDLLNPNNSVTTWTGCTPTAATLGQPAANQQGRSVVFVVTKTADKNTENFTRTTFLAQGADCAAALENPRTITGTIKIISRESGSTADSITYNVDLSYNPFAAPPQGQSGSTPTGSVQLTTIPTRLRIERQAGLLYLARDPETGQPRPPSVDGGDKLKHN